MKANSKRHIRATKSFDHLIPKSIQKDTVIVGSGKAGLDDTLQLMQKVIAETLPDSQKLAAKLKANNVTEICRNIWEFVHQHIQYKMDKTGIEQVRRPSRTWADRFTGVDCDCYTVFIGSILTNLGIPFKMRITKYGGKHHFQHVYPIVPTSNGHIIMDCVTDRFNYEVPYSEKKDIALSNKNININDLGTLSGVDMADISLDALEESPIPLREIRVPQKSRKQGVIPITIPKRTSKHTSGKVLSPFRLDDGSQLKTRTQKKDFNILNFLILSGISVAAGIGVLQLLSKKGSTKNKAKNPKNKPRKNKRTKSTKRV